jgi:hypothetical protein
MCSASQDDFVERVRDRTSSESRLCSEEVVEDVREAAKESRDGVAAGSPRRPDSRLAVGGNVREVHM